ncbi:hypothetical protein FOFC_21022, partial [Fusarium oxysporum]
KRAWLDSGMSRLLPRLSRQVKQAFSWSTSRCYLLFAQKTSNSCIPVYPWCCLFTLDTIYSGEMDLSEIFMPKVAYFGAPLRPLNNLAAEGRAHALLLNIGGFTLNFRIKAAETRIQGYSSTSC